MPVLSRAALPTGVELEYLDAGDGDPVLFLHGYVDSWYSFAGVVAALPAGLRAIAPSQRGHGDSGKPEGSYTVAGFADDAVALLDMLGLERAVACGHSMGSFVALELALSHPHRVSRLALVGGATTADNDALRGLQRDVDGLVDPVDRLFAETFQAGTLSRPLAADVMRTILGETAKAPAHVWRAALAGLVAWRPSHPLGSISCPTWIAWGNKDEIFPQEEQRALAAQIPGAVSKFYDAGHAPHWELPALFAADLAAFATGQEVPGAERA